MTYYIGSLPCGCDAAVVVNKLEWIESVAKEIKVWRKRGYVIREQSDFKGFEQCAGHTGLKGQELRDAWKKIKLKREPKEGA